MNSFLEEYSNYLKRFNISPSRRYHNRRDDKLRHIPRTSLDDRLETIKAMAEHSPLCGGCRQHRRQRILTFNIAAVWYLCIKEGFSDEMAAAEIEEYHRDFLGHSDWEFSAAKIPYLKRQATGEKDIICPGCGKANNLREIPISEISHNLAVTYKAVHGGGAHSHQEIANALGIAKSTLTERCRTVERKIDPFWQTSGRALKRKLREYTGRDLETDAVPTARTKARKKVADDLKKGLGDDFVGEKVVSPNRKDITSGYANPKNG